jgi:acyl carrier protein
MELAVNSLKQPSIRATREDTVTEKPFARRESVAPETETHAAGICLRKVGNRFQVLMAKRSVHRDLFPNMFDCGGGVKKPWETWEGCVQRHMAQGFGVIVKTHPFEPVLDIPLALPYDIRKKDGTLISGLALLCTFESFLHGDFKLNAEEYIENTIDWYDVDSLDMMNIIPGLKEEVDTAVKLTTAMEKLFQQRFLTRSSPTNETKAIDRQH